MSFLIILFSMKRKKLLTLICILALLLLAFFLFFPTEGNNVSYTSFLSSLSKGEIESVTIKRDTLEYKTKNDRTVFITQNPSSQTLKEELLKNDIDVRIENENSLEYYFNLLFDIIFIIIILFALYKLFEYMNKTFRVVKKTGATFSNIAGMDEIKEEMREVVKYLKDDRKSNSVRSIKGIILEGPPGNGKTLFARALSQESGVNFIATKGADFQGAVMGLGALKVKMLFNKARRRKPCIVFIDEFDSIGEKRNYNGSGIDKENNRILTTLLNEMDGFSRESGVLVIAATNSYSSLDPALIRPGRFDLKFTIKDPDYNTRLKLIDIYTKDFSIVEPLSKELLSSLFDGLSCASIETILNETKAISERNEKKEINESYLIEASRKTMIGLKVRRK